jgi:hypothetical protein
MASFIDSQGATQQVEVNLDTVRAATDNSMSVRDWVNTIYPTNPEAYGDAFSQLCASEGIVLSSNKAFGLRSASLDSVINGRPEMSAGAIVKNPNTQARVLLMPAIGALVEDKLLGNLEMNANAFDNMIALDTTIADDWLLWPEVNYAGPEAGRSKAIGQLARPGSMLTLTTSEKSLKVPTFSMGIEWSEQATKYLNLDFIALSITRQVAVERNERANSNILALLNGDLDVGQSALSTITNKVVKASHYDSALVTNGSLSQTAWMMWLYTNSKKRKITHVITDIAGALAIQNRSGRPVITGDNPNSPRINAEMTVANPTWGDVSVFITDDANWPANTIMGIDKQYAIQRVTSTNASYQAQEDFVLRRGSAMRFDYGSISRRLYDDAYDVLSLVA